MPIVTVSRRCRTGVCAVLVACALAGSAVSADAQDRVLWLRLTVAAVEPEMPAFVNVMFDNPDAVPVLALREHIGFPHDHLVFTSARLSVAAQVANAELTVEMKDEHGASVQDREAAHSIDIRITAKQPLENGPLVELQFRTVGTREQTLPLKHSAEAFDAAGQPVRGLVVADGALDVTADTGPAPLRIMGCLFYMH